MRTLKSAIARPALFAGAVFVASLLTSASARAERPVACGYNNVITEPGYPGDGYSDCPTPDEVNASLQQISRDRIKNLITHNRLASPLLGATEQINCGDCIRGFGLAGSFSVGFNGRKALTDRLSVLGGLSYNEFDSKSTQTTRAPIFALGLRYDLADWGSSRPFFEVAGTLSPGERVRTLRIVNVGGAPGAVYGATDAATWSINTRAGWVYRISPVAELAAYVAYARTEQHFGAYAEQGPTNLLPLAYGTSNASINVVKGVVQHTQLLSPMIEAHVSAAIAHGFGAKAGINAVTALPFYGAFTPAAKDSTWAEFDARIGLRIAKGTVIDVFALTTVGSQPVGNTIHGGLGLRYLF